MNKKIFKRLGDFIVSLLPYLIFAAIGYLCAALQSCSMYRQTDINGKATIVTTDTTYINHNTLFKYQKK